MQDDADLDPLSAMEKYCRSELPQQRLAYGAVSPTPDINRYLGFSTHVACCNLSQLAAVLQRVSQCQQHYCS
jgi:hypothetical protein